MGYYIVLVCSVRHADGPERVSDAATESVQISLRQRAVKPIRRRNEHNNFIIRKKKNRAAMNRSKIPRGENKKSQ